MTAWQPDSWRDRPAAQQPQWPDTVSLTKIRSTLAGLPPLVFAGEACNLLNDLGEVCAGQAFVLQAGDCAESFDKVTADSIRNKLKVILQMAVVLTFSAGVPTVKIGRIAGQFAKPRSSSTEVVNGVELPSFRGHMVNDANFSKDARNADAERLVRAYHQSAYTLNLLRAFTKGGYADLRQVQMWNQEFIAASPEGQRYQSVAEGIESALRFMAACGIALNAPELHQVDFYTSHEALVLDYEQALTRQDSITNEWYDCSAHMLWVGERTRQLNGAHVEFLRGIKNPVGCKLGPSATSQEVLGLCEILNPDRVPGRLTLISRMGADKIAKTLPPLLTAVRDNNHPVVWECDPMHGNTYSTAKGRKTRHFEDVMSEIDQYFAIHDQAGTWPGGIHVEITGEDVTECVGGAEAISDDDLERRYETMCDPRLNGTQSLELAFRIAERLSI
ncbi:MAG: 3-deoxy-7-phosphoheptulonate synthase class II [Acidimicrobiia bacterium]|nr:3-deoxy-7-phosphoheptulonate synthase class II [Acidimicrobiia bacterium]MYC58128.1 3-deoxy-7-phosphoheptulonate synthase class II [Acidimicrobiia bacterium]MYG94382.1 3-deoxy-7-phosphoheptulonate synthase class II [Acidimicrobiia bacterium]MYI30560.1 3-deoxy-7-phosphoheptulonate synthase class II [Acidimicrobiia bacterium]